MTVATTRAHLDDVDRRVVALEQDLGRCACLTPAELDGWAKFRTDWRSKLVELRSTVDHVGQGLSAAAVGGVVLQGAAESYASNVLAGVDQEADGYAAELGTWQQRAAARGANLTTPGAPPGMGLPWVTIALVAVGVVAVGAGAWYVYGARAKPKKNPTEAEWARDAAADVRFYEELRESRGLTASERAHLAQLRRELAAYRKRTR
jgi:hypothetical protein